MKIKKWYLEAYSDDYGNVIKDDVTFEGLFDALDNYNCVYEYLGHGVDSVIRERVFAKLAKIMGVPYSEVYEQWTNGMYTKLKKF